MVIHYVPIPSTPENQKGIGSAALELSNEVLTSIAKTMENFPNSALPLYRNAREESLFAQARASTQGGAGGAGRQASELL